jgi:C-terminal AAA-associated domain
LTTASARAARPLLSTETSGAGKRAQLCKPDRSQPGPEPLGQRCLSLGLGGGYDSSRLEDHLTDAAAEKTLDAVVDWGRYAEIFAYDNRAEMFSLEDPKG